MLHTLPRHLAALVMTFLVAATSPALAAGAVQITLQVDATDVTRGIFSVRERVPIARPGKLVLLYPKWLPGYHAPAGPIDKLGGLMISANGKALSWQRDPADVYAFHVGVPAGVAAIDIAFQYLSPVTPQQGRIVATPDMLALEWNTLVLYPQGPSADRIEVAASVKLPEGWSFATSLDATATRTGVVQLQPVTLRTLIDSPLYAGRNFQRVDLDPDAASAVWLNVFADRPQQIALSPDKLAAHRKLVQQADRLFGARPFQRYDFLLTLSDRLGGYGLEHRNSSENSIPADHLLDWDRSVNEERVLLSHEYMHSWNGKFRLSSGLLTPHYHAPVRDTMLWIYEGLTEYWGTVLAARSGLRTPQQSLEAFAALAAASEHRAGRSWRSLADTTNDPIIGRNAPLPWPSWQRGGDYYPEGPLLWLDIDTKIRELSGGTRSLDDFARRFFGMASAQAAPLTYDFDTVTTALNAVQPYDWSKLLKQRLTGSEAPLAGFERGGWKLAYRAVQTAFGAALDGRSGGSDLSYSIGFSIGSDATLREVRWGSPAFEAGLTIGTKLVAVEDIAYSADELQRAIEAAANTQRRIRLLVVNAGRYRTVEIDYHGGLRYPHLERIAAQPDVLSSILAPRE